MFINRFAEFAHFHLSFLHDLHLKRVSKFNINGMNINLTVLVSKVRANSMELKTFKIVKTVRINACFVFSSLVYLFPH